LRFAWGDPVNEDAVLRSVERLLTPAELADRAQLGLTMTDLRKTSVEMGYEAVIGRLEVSELYTTKIPLIVAIRLQTGLDHFVVFRGIVGGQVYLADPFRGNLRMPVDDFTKQWIDNAVVVVARPGETEPPNNQLVVRWDEASTQALNYQYIRTRPERTWLPTTIR
jgi:predicted double-glycine peptidase